jgi:2-polyprenyl-3-methyl-5-hydroxy-6-metoxy-1,4-benzoquinol methylase
MKEQKQEHINCPCCQKDDSFLWAQENGFRAVKCYNCGFVYVNPRPRLDLISESVKSGIHSIEEEEHDVSARRVENKVDKYKGIFLEMFRDKWQSGKPISWLDLGAGYGEIVEAVSKIAGPSSDIQGIEPMSRKVQEARKLNLNIKEGYLSDDKGLYDVISVVNVFSHIPNIQEFLKEIKSRLNPEGELFLETGNIGDLSSVAQVPTELDLPDHLIFAGEQNIIDLLAITGFEVVAIKKKRKDGMMNFIKSIAKKLLGRKIRISLPYTTGYKTLMVRAKLLKTANDLV